MELRELAFRENGEGMEPGSPSFLPKGAKRYRATWSFDAMGNGTGSEHAKNFFVLDLYLHGAVRYFLQGTMVH